MPTLPNAALWRDAGKPTAGRWYQRGHEILAEHQAASATRIVVIVAEVEPGVHALADARLIAAAPDLRDALRESLRVGELLRRPLYQGGGATDEELDALAKNVIQSARAIAKSEGR